MLEIRNYFFISVGLFKDLSTRAIYAKGTMRLNCVGTPIALKDKKAFNRTPQGTLKWRMHESRLTPKIPSVFLTNFCSF
jgi:hypothetical protein